MTTEDALELFHKARWNKHVKGVIEHRNGDFNAPYTANQPKDYCDEQLDSVNYLEDDLNRGRISQAEFDYASQRHFEMWNWRRNRG